jgi:uncharacterized protein YaiI (UPF0178 family)
MLTIYIDADACPVREEIYRVAARHALPVIVVTRGNVRVPFDPAIRLVLVGEAFDAADDWIAEHIGAGDLCITADIPLAARCLKNAAHAISPTGRRFTPNNIGEALAAREMSAHLRELGTGSSGPRPLQAKDRSRFLQEIEAVIQAVKLARR